MTEEEFLDKVAEWDYVTHTSLSDRHSKVQKANYGKFIIYRCIITPIKNPSTEDKRKGSIYYMVIPDAKRVECRTLGTLIKRLKELGFLH